MNEQQLAAVKQALGALEIVRPLENPEPAVEEAIAALQSIISQDALYKMAEDAVTIGLSYNDWPKIGCVNHDCDQCKAVQEPVKARHTGWSYLDGQVVATYAVPVNAQIAPDLYIAPPTPQPVPVKTYHDGKPWPVAPKPWVGLTDEEAQWIYDNGRTPSGMMEMVEAKLREKNT